MAERAPRLPSASKRVADVVKGVEAAGHTVASITVTRSGEIKVILAQPADTAAPEDGEENWA